MSQSFDINDVQQHDREIAAACSSYYQHYKQTWPIQKHYSVDLKFYQRSPGHINCCLHVCSKTHHDDEAMERNLVDKHDDLLDLGS